MSATTARELTGALRRAQNAAAAAGVDVAGWALHGGSKTAGVTFKLATGARLIHLGMTRTEAWRALTSMAQAFEMVRSGAR